MFGDGGTKRFGAPGDRGGIYQDIPLRPDSLRLAPGWVAAWRTKVVRTAQYGCNCRGMGGNGGCGEFDIIEAVIGNENSDMLFTTVYDFKGTGSPGFNKYFLRPSVSTV